jgi:hypothetical protein
MTRSRPSWSLPRSRWPGDGSHAYTIPGAGAFKMVADPAAVDWWRIVGILFILVIYVTMVYGPIAAILVEMFPTRIRYTGMSLPYHIGNGWFGGLLPATVFAMSAAAGDIYYGLWYPIAIAAMTLVIGSLFVKDTLAPISTLKTDDALGRCNLLDRRQRVLDVCDGGVNQATAEVGVAANEGDCQFLGAVCKLQRAFMGGLDALMSGRHTLLYEVAGSGRHFELALDILDGFGDRSEIVICGGVLCGLGHDRSPSSSGAMV